MRVLIAYHDPTRADAWASMVKKQSPSIVGNIQDAEIAFYANLGCVLEESGQFTHVIIGELNLRPQAVPTSVTLIRKMREQNPRIHILAVSGVMNARKEMVLAGADEACDPLEVCAKLHQFAMKETANAT